jgi:hypothetical protein
MDEATFVAGISDRIAAMIARADPLMFDHLPSPGAPETRARMVVAATEATLLLKRLFLERPADVEAAAINDVFLADCVLARFDPTWKRRRD